PSAAASSASSAVVPSVGAASSPPGRRPQPASSRAGPDRSTPRRARRAGVERNWRRDVMRRFLLRRMAWPQYLSDTRSRARARLPAVAVPAPCGIASVHDRATPGRCPDPRSGARRAAALHGPRPGGPGLRRPSGPGPARGDRLLALRTGGDLAGVLAAFDRGEVVRGYPMRGTVFAVAADSLAWLTQLCAGGPLRSAISRRPALDLE